MISSNNHNIEASYEEEDHRVTILVNGEAVRSVSPIHMKTYRFNIGKDDYYFLYEEQVFRGKKYRQLYFFPINEFKDNKIQL